MFCSNCGQELAPESKFCSNCGAPVSSGAPGSKPSSSDRDWGGYASESREENEQAIADTSPPPPPADQPYTAEGFADRKPTWEMERERLRGDVDDEWSMASLGPAKPQRRRTWLWVLLGMIAVAMIACCVFFYWIMATESGTSWFEGIATQAAEEMQRATETAATPQP